MRKTFTELILLFGIFVPFGYLPIYWALPISISCLLYLAGNTANEYNKRKKGK